MKFQSTIVENYPDGVTLAVEVRVEAPDGDTARPVADAAMAALEARPLPPAVTRRVVPVAVVRETITVDYPAPAVMGADEVGVTIVRGCFVADDDGMRRDSRE